MDLYWATDLVRPPGFLNNHLLVPKTVNLLAGGFGVGKTMLTMKLAIAVAQGVPFGHFPIHQAKVLYLSQEMTQEEFRERIVGLLDAHTSQLVSGNLTIICREDYKLDSDFGAGQLKALIEEAGADLVIIDALSDIRGTAEENSNDQMGHVFRRLRDDVAETTGACILVLHHFGRPDMNGREHARGAVSIEDVCSDVMYASMMEGKRVVRFRKTRHMAQPDAFSFSIESTEDEFRTEVTIRKEDDAESDLWKIKKLLDLVRAAGGQMAQADLCATSGLSQATTLSLLKLAFGSGFLAKSIEGNRVVWSVPSAAGT